MAAPVKPGTAERYWREVAALRRLELALQQDEALSDEERQPLVASIVAVTTLLMEVAKSRTALVVSTTTDTVGEVA